MPAGQNPRRASNDASHDVLRGPLADKKTYIFQEMECDKDGAIRAKEIAEEKLLERDITGAKKFALKAQNLFPNLDGLSQFFEVIDVYVSHEKKINGETNYYETLGVDPLSSEDVLKKQYKRRALALHPDKNKSVGADGAFKILSQAWSILSDKDKKYAYDSKLNIRSAPIPNVNSSFTSSTSMNTTTTTLHVPTRARTTMSTPRQNYSFSPQHIRNPNYSQFVPIIPRPRNPASHTHNQYTTPFSNPQSSRSYQNTSATETAPQYIPIPRPPSHHNYAGPSRNVQPTSSSHPMTPQTFWTCCSRCRIQYEYEKIYLNQNLLCHRCSQPFLATEMHAPGVNRRSARPWPYPQQQQGVFAALNGFTSVLASSSASRTAEAAPCQPSSESLKRRHKEAINMPMDNDALRTNNTVPEKVEASNPGSRGLNGEKNIKRRRTDGQQCDNAKEGGQGKATSKSGLKRTSVNLKRNVGGEQESSYVKELSPIEIRDMLMRKAKTEMMGCLKFRESAKSKSSEMNKVERKNSKNALDKMDSKTAEAFIDQKITLKETDDADVNQDETVSMAVPDANFHNFDEDRVEGSFTENQVWAAYDDDDGMPRYYAFVHHVISRKPFKIQISWLNSKSTVEFGDLNWIGSGFTKLNGNFRVGKSVVSKKLNSFSHPVKWKKGARGAIQIFPMKGDIWALYRNWSRDWDEITADETIHKYDVVAVLQDYDEDRGVLVASLVKVAGFTSVFNQRVDPMDIRTIPRGEMFRFSHQVPYCILNGLEGENAPNGCYELDPAALPLELLKVITDAASMEEERNAKRILTYSRKKKGKEIEGNVERTD
ncbi:hypothetical protein BUALT_Bualt07G0088600 [Buddleja alternifolia]|uniref:J domain-containing protein n=1 Tax=Buddleja alternifolia TaxID=168488 RepID=A0AAV6XK63_9LAMI|nr:hypothetical protein BUALT_Bualt07G0088600 [Buddleja alternifolia]